MSLWHEQSWVEFCLKCPEPSHWPVLFQLWWLLLSIRYSHQIAISQQGRSLSGRRAAESRQHYPHHICELRDDGAAWAGAGKREQPRGDSGKSACFIKGQWHLGAGPWLALQCQWLGFSALMVRVIHAGCAMSSPAQCTARPVLAT